MKIPQRSFGNGYWHVEDCERNALTKSYWPADESTKLLDTTVSQVLISAAKNFPDRYFLVEGIANSEKRRRWTYAQTLKQAKKIASALLTRFKPGDHIAIWAPNVPEWVFIELGCALAGMVIVTIIPANQETELRHIVESANVSCIFVLEEYRGRSLIDIANRIKTECACLKEVVGFSELESFVAAGNEINELPEVYPRSPLMVMFTSGTTGKPKGVVLHNMGIINGCVAGLDRAGFEEGGVYINSIPMSHMGGCAIATIGVLAKHGTQVILNSFDSELMLKLFEEEKGTFTSLVPTMVEAMLNHPKFNDYDLSSFKSFILGGANVPAELVEKANFMFNARAAVSFGQTETHGVMSGTHADDSLEDQYKTVGQPIPNCEVKIADINTGEILPIGFVGEICCRGFNTMLRYEKMPEETAKVLKEDGWLHLGDLGSMDDRGFIKVTGRINDLIIRGGENIDASEIENLLKQDSRVSQAVVVGIEDKYWGEEVHVVIVPSNCGGVLEANELYEFCDAHLAHFKVPRYWYFEEQIPMTHSGKIQKMTIKEYIKTGKYRVAAIFKNSQNCI
ncbi:MAG: class I adenylate-forming enzyme family protein [Candidatus Scatomorpha sp.]|jgi:fatty-acyl-CoA synthase